MSVDFSCKTEFLLNVNNVTSILTPYFKLPDYCPICRKYINPAYLLLHQRSVNHHEILCGCPRIECNSYYFVEYKKDPRDYSFELMRYYPSSKSPINFPEEITSLSVLFVEIYTQSLQAEEEGLNLICGIGYRKAFEYLIKDYSISLYSDQKEKIKVMPLQQCIRQFINNEDIKALAERAVWLGNDETHYTKKWENQDIHDLKSLIDLTVYFITMSLKASYYMKTMSRD